MFTLFADFYQMLNGNFFLGHYSKSEETPPHLGNILCGQKEYLPGDHVPVQ